MLNNMGEERIKTIILKIHLMKISKMKRKIQEPEDVDFNLYKEKIDCLKTKIERRFSK